ncbi:LysM peptidoglycan-binding domain-containing protein [Flavobacterium hungaricum]|uniref:LysM peptidoglycan-binding domain-containing protein n=1 Tax=Flavobacterium hungaricum TaxID=2082725 RepID=A0ABR9TLH8_9FLAO|nr:LysM domain-containing protein [Flavobacterium hungaricum]MBE8725694.1 LysM peptidoglycan-binding domain-containing protein [Flavobacterium hungaricum]
MHYIPESSYEDYLTYKIKKGDTLFSVAQDLGIEPYLLRSYHNRFVPSTKDLIEADFPHHLEYLILEPQKAALTDEEKEQNRTKINTKGSFKLSLDNSHINKSYSVLYSIEKGKNVYDIKQEFNVKWRAKNEDGYSFFEVSRIGDLYINDTQASTMATEIAEKASAALYPLLVVVDQSGKWVYINNFNQIEERWIETKKQIQKYYKGEMVEKYFSIYDRNLEDSDSLYISLSRDWFLNAFFNEIHIEYPSSLSIQKEQEFPFLAKNDNLNFKVELKVDEYLDIDNFLVIDVNGKLNDHRTKTDLEKDLGLAVKEYSEEKTTGNYRAKYFLNPQNHMPEVVFISCDLALETPQKFSVTISNKDDQREMRVKPAAQLFVEEVEPKKKWWQF